LNIKKSKIYISRDSPEELDSLTNEVSCQRDVVVIYHLEKPEVGIISVLSKTGETVSTSENLSKFPKYVKNRGD
jgi:hypothetical protein